MKVKGRLKLRILSGEFQKTRNLVFVRVLIGSFEKCRTPKSSDPRNPVWNFEEVSLIEGDYPHLFFQLLMTRDGNPNKASVIAGYEVKMDRVVQRGVDTYLRLENKNGEKIGKLLVEIFYQPGPTGTMYLNTVQDKNKHKKKAKDWKWDGYV